MGRSHRKSDTVVSKSEETSDGEEEDEELIKTIQSAIEDKDVGHCKRSTESMLDKAAVLLNGRTLSVEDSDDMSSIHSGSLSFNMEDLQINDSNTISLEMKSSLSDGLEYMRGGNSKYSILSMFDRDEVVENEVVETERKYFVD